MREWCGCGAAIRARRSDVLTWRAEHHHGATEPAQEGHPPTSGGSHLENAERPQTGFIPETAE